MTTYTEIVRDTARQLVDVALTMLEKDSHNFQARPCATCRAISNLLDRPTGCVKREASRDG